MTIKYRKIYQGYVTGSLGGRDDGYPEERIVEFDTLEDLAKDHNTKDNERYQIIEIKPAPYNFEKMINEAKKRNNKKEQENEREKLESQIIQLKHKLELLDTFNEI